MTDAAGCAHPNRRLEFEYAYDAHDEYSIYRCTDCGAWLLRNQWERVDWEHGDDTQHTFWSVLTPEEVEHHWREAKRWGE